MRRRRRRMIIFITRFSVTVYMTIRNLTFYMPIYFMRGLCKMLAIIAWYGQNDIVLTNS